MEGIARMRQGLFATFVVCFPAFFVVTLGPAVIKFVEVMYGQIMVD